MPKVSAAQSMTIPPPVMGWNTKDPISQMDPKYAVEAVNYFSNGATVDLRNGYRYFSKNIGIGSSSIVYSTFELALQNGTRKLLAVGDDYKVYDCTSGGASPTDLSAGGTKLVYSTATALNFRNKIFIKDTGMGISGSTGTWYWDGSSGSITDAAITGPTGGGKYLANPQSYKNRMYFVGNDASIWYGGVDAITGAFTQFDVQSVLLLGGKLLFAGGVTKTGDTNQQYFAMISDMGEVLLYQGDYPASQTWALIGRYMMAPPVGYRSFFYWGPNLVIITYQGVIAFSEVMKGEQFLTYLSDKINDQFVSTFSTSLQSYAVSGVHYPKGNLILINIMTAIDDVTEQFVMNTITGSWWRWTGMLGYHWTLFNNNLYFAGGFGRVFKADNGYFDEDPSVEGTARARSVKLRPAYNYFGNTEQVKQFTEARPIIYESEGLSLTMDSDVDYANTTATSTVTDTADTSYKLYRPRMGLQGIGKAASIRIDGTVTTKRRSIQAIDVLWQEGDLT